MEKEREGEGGVGDPLRAVGAVSKLGASEILGIFLRQMLRMAEGETSAADKFGSTEAIEYSVAKLLKMMNTIGVKWSSIRESC